MRYAGKELTESEREELFGETSSSIYESLVTDDMHLHEMAVMEAKEMTRMEMLEFLNYGYADEIVSHLDDTDLMEMVVDSMMDAVWNDSETMMYDDMMISYGIREEDFEDELLKEEVMHDMYDEEFEEEFEEMYDDFMDYMGYDEPTYIEDFEDEL